VRRGRARGAERQPQIRRQHLAFLDQRGLALLQRGEQRLLRRHRRAGVGAGSPRPYAAAEIDQPLEIYLWNAEIGREAHSELQRLVTSM
jgi:hypothetical protein